MINIGDRLPDISLTDTELKPFSLSGVKGKATVVAFFPGAFTGVCTKEMCTFRDNIQKLNNMGGNVVAISVDGPFPNKEFKEKNKLNFPVLSDYNRDAVRAFGIELNDFAHLKGYVAAKRSIFIVDKEGKVGFKWVSDDPTVEPDYDAVMQKVSSFK